MNQVRWGQVRGLIVGVLMAGVLVGVVYGQTKGGQVPAGPAAGTASAGKAPAGQAPAGTAPAGPTPSAAAAAKPTSPDTVVLKVGDTSVTAGEVERFIKGLTPQAQNVLARQGRRPLGDDFVKLLVLSQDALSHHLDSTPAYRDLLAVHRREVLAQLAYQEIMQRAEITREEISAYYTAHHSEYEETQLYQVVVRKKPQRAKEGDPGLSAEDAKARAEEIRKAMSSGDDPKKVAEKYSKPGAVRVDGYPEIVHRGELRDDMEKAAFELKEGQVTDVYDLGYALAFLKVDKHIVVDLDTASPKIQTTLQQEKINSALDELKKKANVWMDESYFGPPVAEHPPRSLGSIHIPINTK